jgi:hypothetical protein
MKAKEIAAYLLNNEEQGTGMAALHEMLFNMMEEIQSLVKLRNVASDEAVISIVKEQHQKWKAVVRICEKGGLYLAPDAFYRYFMSMLDNLAVDAVERQTVAAKLRNAKINT